MAETEPLVPLDQDTRALIERLLSTRFGGRFRLGEGLALQGRTTVYRLPILEGPADAPSSVVVKRPPPDQPYDPAATDFPSPASLFFNHWAGLDFLGQVAADQPLAPRCYAGDRAAGVVVMEDLGQGQGIDDLLLGDDLAAAATALIEL